MSRLKFQLLCGLMSQYPGYFDIDSMKEKAELSQSHDSLFHTLLGLMDVETEVYKKDLDLTAK